MIDSNISVHNEVERCMRQLKGDFESRLAGLERSHHECRRCIEKVEQACVHQRHVFDDLSKSGKPIDAIIVHNLQQRVMQLEDEISTLTSLCSKACSEMPLKQPEDARTECGLKNPKQGSDCQPSLEALSEELKSNIQMVAKQCVADALADSLGTRLSQCQDELQERQTSLISEFVTSSNLHAEYLMDQLSSQWADDQACTIAAKELAERSQDARNLCEKLSAALNNMNQDRWSTSSSASEDLKSPASSIEIQRCCLRTFEDAAGPKMMALPDQAKEVLNQNKEKHPQKRETFPIGPSSQEVAGPLLPKMTVPPDGLEKDVQDRDKAKLPEKRGTSLAVASIQEDKENITNSARPYLCAGVATAHRAVNDVVAGLPLALNKLNPQDLEAPEALVDTSLRKLGVTDTLVDTSLKKCVSEAAASRMYPMSPRGIPSSSWQPIRDRVSRSGYATPQAPNSPAVCAMSPRLKGGSSPQPGKPPLQPQQHAQPQHQRLHQQQQQPPPMTPPMPPRIAHLVSPPCSFKTSSSVGAIVQGQWTPRHPAAVAKAPGQILERSKNTVATLRADITRSPQATPSLLTDVARSPQPPRLC